jgi:hypothetical protein
MTAVPTDTTKAEIKSIAHLQLITCGISTFRPFQSTSMPQFGQIHPPSSQCLLVFACGQTN